MLTSTTESSRINAKYQVLIQRPKLEPGSRSSCNEEKLHGKVKILNASELKDVLPPIVLSLGAILPFLIASPPFAVANNARVLLISIMTLTIWIGYWTAFALGEPAFSTIWIPGVLVAATLAIFSVLFHVAQRPATPKTTTVFQTDEHGQSSCKTVPAKDANGQPILEAKIDEPIYLWIYLIGMVLLSVAAALYVGSREEVIVELALDTETNSFNPKITEVLEEVPKMPSLSLNIYRLAGVTVVILPKAEYGAFTMLHLNVEMKANVDNNHLSPTDKPNQIPYFAEREIAQRLLNPGLGERVRITAHRQR
jgi:hypothetical protein